MVVANVWTVEEILEYLAEYKGTIVLRDGSPMLDLPRWPTDRWGKQVDRTKIADAVLSHLKARKREILDWCAEQEDPELFRANEERRERERNLSAAEVRRERELAECEANRDERAALVAELREKAKTAGKKLWWMITLPWPIEMKGDGLTKLPDEATFVAIEGGGEWIALPKIAPDPEPKKRQFAPQAV